MDLTVRTISHQSEDRAWLGSAHGTEATESITVVPALFTRTQHFPNGFIPSGMPVALVTSGEHAGLHGPYDPTKSNGQQDVAGHLFSSVTVTEGGPNIGAALHWHGAIVIARLPANHGLDPAGMAAVSSRLRYR